MTAVGGLMLMVWGILYFLPYIIAKSKKRANTQAIFWVNCLLGITIIGWLWALIWALTNKVTKEQEIEMLAEAMRRAEVKK